MWRETVGTAGQLCRLLRTELTALRPVHQLSLPSSLKVWGACRRFAHREKKRDSRAGRQMVGFLVYCCECRMRESTCVPLIHSEGVLAFLRRPRSHREGRGCGDFSCLWNEISPVGFSTLSSSRNLTGLVLPIRRPLLSLLRSPVKQ